MRSPDKTMFILFILSFGVFNVQAVNIFNDVGFKPKNLERLSDICQQQYDALPLLTLLKMFDASSKIPEGLLTLNFYHLGHFDECYYTTEKTDVGVINGQYCLGTLQFPVDAIQANNLDDNYLKSVLNSTKVITPRSLGGDMTSIGFHFAFCIPSGCTTEDIANMTAGVLTFSEDFCYSKNTEPELSAGAIATITVLGLVIAITIVSTVIDVVYYKMKAKVPHDVLTAFSAFSNGKKLISSTSNSDQLLCLNGMRALSMMWVITGHVFQNSMSGPVASYEDALNHQSKTENMFLYGATVSVDTFFAIAGIVIVYSFLRACDKGVKFNLIAYYLHRYIRLTPALAVMIALYATVITYLGNGPMWHGLNSQVLDCRQKWWAALLYIQDYVHNDQVCVPQSWYLSVDFQLYILSPLVLLPLKWKPKLGLGVIGFGIVAGIIVPGVIGYVYELPAYFSADMDPDKANDMMVYYYNQTHTRMGPYVIGMLFGYFIYKLKKNQTNIDLKPIEYLPLWAISLAGLAACVYSYHDVTTYDRVPHAFALAFLRNGWGLAVCIIIYLCVTGYGGVVDWFLALPIFQFLTKISYSMYLVHFPLISMRYAATKYSFEFSNGYMFWSFWGDFMFTLGLSVVLCLTFESPIIILEKHLFGLGSSKQNERLKEKLASPA